MVLRHTIVKGQINLGFLFQPIGTKNNANQYLETRYSAIGWSKIIDSNAIPENDSVWRLFLMFGSSQYK